MQNVTRGLWRIEFRTDLTRASAPVIPLGYVSEAQWHNHARWLGLLFRRSLSRVELDHVNLETWPELQNMEQFMNELFNFTWAQKVAGQAELGATALAARYTVHSALQLVPHETRPIAEHPDVAAAFGGLYTDLIGMRKDLVPVLTADVVSLKRRPPAAAPPADVEVVNKAA